MSRFFQRRPVLILVLAFPLLVLAGMVAFHALEMNRGKNIWRIDITGYDPRDPLYGHYLVFRYDWNMSEARAVPTNTPGPHCLCLTTSGETNANPAALPMECGAAPLAECASVVKAWPHHGDYSLNRNSIQERYLIPEQYAPKLERMLREGKHGFAVDLITRDDGSARVRGLFIDDVPLDDYVRGLPE